MIERLLRKWLAFVERVTRPNVSEMTQEEFAKLTEDDLKKLRGDVPAWETEWITNVTYADQKLVIFRELVHKHGSKKAAQLTNVAFNILFKQPRQQRTIQ